MTRRMFFPEWFPHNSIRSGSCLYPLGSVDQESMHVGYVGPDSAGWQWRTYSDPHDGSPHDGGVVASEGEARAACEAALAKLGWFPSAEVATEESIAELLALAERLP